MSRAAGPCQGGSSRRQVTNLITEMTTKISKYAICKGLPDFDLRLPTKYDIGGTAGYLSSAPALTVERRVERAILGAAARAKSAS